MPEKKQNGSDENSDPQMLMALGAAYDLYVALRNAPNPAVVTSLDQMLAFAHGYTLWYHGERYHALKPLTDERGGR